MPDVLIDQLGLKEWDTSMHQYIVTENGNVMVPWCDFIDPEVDEDITCAIHNEIEFFDAQDLVRAGLKEYRDTLKQMLDIMIRFHNDRFDREQKGEA
jgi:hypothetical protein